MEKKVTISVDSTADLTNSEVEKYDFKIIPNGIVIGGEFKSDADVTVEDIYRAIEDENDKPKTNAALEIDYRRVFEDGTANGGSVLHFGLGGKLSTSLANAQRAAKDFERVYVIDAKTVSFGIAILAIKAHQMVVDGLGVEEIVSRVESLRDRLTVSFLMNDLKFLHRGGRVSGMKLLGANLLKIRPTIDFDKEGAMIPGKKFKGNYATAARDYVKFRLSKNPNANKDEAYLCYTETDPAIPAQVEADLRAAGFKNVEHHKIGPAVAIHTGRCALGIFMFNDVE